MSRSNVARLVVSCPDREGIIALLSAALRDSGANIISSDQYSSDPYGGSFSLRMEFYIPNPDERFGPLEERLAEIGAELGLDYRLVDAKRPKRVALFVSKYDHCLLDLLWRWRRKELDMDVVAVVSNHPDLQEEVARVRCAVPPHPGHQGDEDRGRAGPDRSAQWRGRARCDGALHADPVADFLEKIGAPVINIHHSFLPAFAGAGPYARAHDAA